MFTLYPVVTVDPSTELSKNSIEFAVVFLPALIHSRLPHGCPRDSSKKWKFKEELICTLDVVSLETSADLKDKVHRTD